MLARHAEDLFWTGRYLERAEDTARMLDVTYHGLLEGGSADTESAWRMLLEALHLAHPFYAAHPEVSARAVAEFLVADVAQGSSIIAAIARARENARNVREHLSTELWDAINSCFLELRARDLQAELAVQPHELYREIRTRCQTIAGAGAETMSRSDPWRFLLLGRLIERAEMTCRMLRARAPRRDPRSGFHDFLLVLNSVSALEAYTRAAKDPSVVAQRPEASLGYARLLSQEKRWSEARGALERVIRSDDKTAVAAAAVGIGETYQGEGDYLAAAEYFMTAAYVAPDSPAGRRGLLGAGASFTALKQVDAAATVCRKLLGQTGVPPEQAEAARKCLKDIGQ